MSDRRIACEDANRFLLGKVMPMLSRVCSTRANTLDSWHFAISLIRDILAKAAAHRVEYSYDDEFEEMYLPIADALAFVNDALKTNPIEARPVRLAYGRMLDLMRYVEQSADKARRESVA